MKGPFFTSGCTYGKSSLQFLFFQNKIEYFLVKSKSANAVGAVSGMIAAHIMLVKIPHRQI